MTLVYAILLFVFLVLDIYFFTVEAAWGSLWAIVWGLLGVWTAYELWSLVL